MQSKDNRLRLDIVSQPLFREAIQTLPFLPQHSEIRLVARGNGVIPNSRLTLQYHSTEGFKGFLPISYESFQFIEPSLKNMPGLISGGRIKEIELKARGEGFAEFRDSLLPLFSKNGYELYKGDLWLSTEHSNEHYMEGDYRTGGLRFESRDIIFSGLELDFDYGIDEKKRKQLEDWFSQLSSKYK